MNKTKTTWATAENYETAHKYLEDKGLDSQNEYLYKELLESQGVTVYMADLKKWLKSLGTTLDTKGFSL